MRFATIPELPSLLVLTLISGMLPVPASAQPQSDAPPFRVTVVEGEGSINNIRQAVNRGATVLVEDDNKNPLSGVAVSFYLPNEGPSGVFPNGGKMLTVFTDDKGMASSRTVRFNNLVGLMRMQVTATLFSQTASAVITQTNVSDAAAMKTGHVPSSGLARVSKPSGPPRKGRILLLVAGAAAAGAAIFFLTRSSPPAATIGGGTTVGVPTIGGPK
jgi:hypothetical protein